MQKARKPKLLEVAIMPNFAGCEIADELFFHWWTVASTINKVDNGDVAGFMRTTPPWTYLVGELLFAGPALLVVSKIISVSLVT